MAREKGTSIFPATYEVRATSALDPRIVVHKKSDLISIDTWPTNGKDIDDPNLIVFIYNGMEVTVLNDIEADTDLPQGHIDPTYNPISYRLIDNTKWNSYDGWQKLNTGKNGIFDSLSVGNLFNINSNGATFNVPVTFNSATIHKNGIESAGHILPKDDNRYNIGALNKSWKNIYAYNEVLHNNLTVLGGSIYSAPKNDGTTREIIHASDERFDLGKGFINKTLWIHANEFKFNTQTISQAVIISSDGKVGIGNVGGAPAAKLHVADGYVIANGYKLWTKGVDTMNKSGYAVMTNGSYMKISTISSSFEGSFGTTEQTTEEGKVDVASTGHIHSGSTGTSSGNTTVASKDHKHTITASGKVKPNFLGSTVTSGGSNLGSNVDVSIKNHTHTGTATTITGTIDVASTGHTHSGSTGTSSGNTTVARKDHKHTITASGKVKPEFSGSTVTSKNNGPSVTYDSTKLVLSITTGHTHYVTTAGTIPEIDVTVAGNTTNIDGTIDVASSNHAHTVSVNETTSDHTSVAKADHTHVVSVTASNSYVTVAKSGHTHSVTTEGTIPEINVAVAGTTINIEGTTDVASSNHAHTVSVNETTSDHTSVAKANHTHIYKPSGSVSSEFAK